MYIWDREKLRLLTTTQGTHPPTIHKVDLDHIFFVEMKCNTLGNEISTFYYKHFIL